jgi:hypothetical protein
VGTRAWAGDDAGEVPAESSDSDARGRRAESRVARPSVRLKTEEEEKGRVRAVVRMPTVVSTLTSSLRSLSSLRSRRFSALMSAAALSAMV